MSSSRRSRADDRAASLLARDEARRMAANVAQASEAGALKERGEALTPLPAIAILEAAKPTRERIDG
jgi:hypothetical protein